MHGLCILELLYAFPNEPFYSLNMAFIMAFIITKILLKNKIFTTKIENMTIICYNKANDTKEHKRGQEMKTETIHIAFCDDELLFAEKLKKKCEEFLIAKEFNYNISIFSDGLSLIHSEEEIDIVFLDIGMPGIDGFEVAEILNKRKKKVIIIFVTSHNEMISRGYHVKAFRYLTKPIEQCEFIEAIENALKEWKYASCILILSDGNNYVIETGSITHIESLGEGSAVYTEQDRYITVYTMQYWMRLLDNCSFIRSHRAYIVNLGYIQKIDNNKIILKNNMEVPVAIRSKKKVVNMLYNYVRYIARR